ncbi:7tm odorant receptor domain-containing protein [Phthorimaea operculella]|nr:7tm odorant receptor domain-containing protein [Phthorimaea operculella]
MTTMRTTPNYEIAYTLNCIAVFVTCYPSASIFVFYIIISGYIEAQMLALAQELTSVWADAVKFGENNLICVTIYLKDSESTAQIQNGESSIAANICRSRSKTRTSSAQKSYTNHDSSQSLTEPSTNEEKRQAYVRRHLTDIVKSHTICMSLLKQVEEVFNIGIAFEFLFIFMGLTADLLGDLAKTYIQLPFVLSSISIDCLTGQRIKDASLVFEKAVYDSKWENFDVTNRKIILLMLRSAQKGLKLTAGGFAALTSECLMGVLKTTYSAYTTLRSTVKR